MWIICKADDMKCQPDLFSGKNKQKKLGCCQLRILLGALKVKLQYHYENTPIQIYRKFDLQKLK